MSGAEMFLLSLVWILSGCVTGSIAEKQGRSFFSWFIAGLLCFIVAFLYLLLSKPSDETMLDSGKYRKCPHCAEIIKVDANLCRYCGSELPSVNSKVSYDKEQLADGEHQLGDNERLVNKTEAFFKIIGAIILTFIFAAIIISVK